MIGWIENDSWLHQMRMMGYEWFIGIDGGEMFHEFWFGMVVSTGFFVGVGSTIGARSLGVLSIEFEIRRFGLSKLHL